MANSEEATLGNQEAILKNQSTIIENQESILKNQNEIKDNQQTIAENQSTIVDNQKQIVDNQIMLKSISKTQVYILNLVRKVSGVPEPLEDTVKFIDELKSETKGGTSTNLAEPESL